MLSPQTGHRQNEKHRRGASQAPLRPVPSKLVIELQSELDLSRIVGSIASRSNFAEVRTRVIERIGDGDYTVAAKSGRIEIRMV